MLKPNPFGSQLLFRGEPAALRGIDPLRRRQERSSGIAHFEDDHLLASTTHRLRATEFELALLHAFASQGVRHGNREDAARTEVLGTIVREEVLRRVVGSGRLDDRRRGRWIF